MSFPLRGDILRNSNFHRNSCLRPSWLYLHVWCAEDLASAWGSVTQAHSHRLCLFPHTARIPPCSWCWWCPIQNIHSGADLICFWVQGPSPAVSITSAAPAISPSVLPAQPLEAALFMYLCLERIVPHGSSRDPSVAHVRSTTIMDVLASFLLLW